MKVNSWLPIKKTLQVIAAALLSLIISSCGKVSSDSILSESIVYCSEGSPTSFNPQLVTTGTTIDATSKQIYNRLLGFDPSNFDKIPALAKSWHVTKNNKLVTFYLRKDVKFHQTNYFTPSRNMNADDVIFSFKRILDEKQPFYKSADGKFPFFQSVKFNELVQDVEKIDDYTVRFRLNHPQSSFLANIAAPFSVILSKEYADHLIEQKKDLTLLDNLPIGTGPFKYKDYRNGSLIRFERHEDYWRRKVSIEKLLYNISPDNTIRLTKLLTHECDVISYPIATQEIASRPDLALEHVTSFNVAFLAFNTKVPPFDNPLVRKAVAHAIDKDAIVSAVYYEQAEVAQSLLPKASWAYSDKVEEITYSKDLAIKLLSDAGLSDGFSIDVWAVPVHRAYNPDARKMAKLIKSDLADIGIEVNIITFEWATFLKKLAKGEHQSVLIGWSADHPDPDNFFSPLLSCASVNTGGNRAMWCNEEFDQLLQASLLTNNTSKRKKLYLQAQQLLQEHLPVFPIAHAKRGQAKVKGIEGNILTPFGGISFEDVSKKGTD
ncbi:ABC transporter substrate-binding protein [Thalassotalea psychrophila]|uniref:ABC transporter substrate-binding protein n=1 Tax=Thalassotalea psychrophila TaxID=3065647 RepID=A0ABY9TYA2_9GAMM|nr:ABC transporter substrate-binding protein [Colwelliaceae bacterium SQ149]